MALVIRGHTILNVRVALIKQQPHHCHGCLILDLAPFPRPQWIYRNYGKLFRSILHKPKLSHQEQKRPHFLSGLGVC